MPIHGRTTTTGRTAGAKTRGSSSRASSSRAATADAPRADDGDAARFDRSARPRAHDDAATKGPTTAGDDAASRRAAGMFRALDLRAQQAAFSPRKRYDVDGRVFTGAQLETMRQDWLLLVLKRQSTSTGFRRKHGLSKPELNALRRQWPQDFGWGPRRAEKTFSPRVVEAATKVVESYHAEEMTFLELRRELEQLGVAATDHGALQKQLPDGMPIARRSTRGYQQKRRARFAAMADDVEALLRTHHWVVAKQTDLLDVLNASADFKAKYPPQTKDGSYTNQWLIKLRKQDEKEGTGRIGRIFDAVKPAGKRGRLQPNGFTAVGAERTTTARSDGPLLREQLMDLAQMLAGQTPSEAALKKTIAAYEKKSGVKRAYKLWRLVMEKHKGVVPELQRWRVGTKNDLTLRWLARWVLAIHEAGPAASVDDVAKVFQRSREYAEDGRVPDVKIWSAVKQQKTLGWEISPVARAHWQLARNLLEAIRTAPRDRDLKATLAQTEIRPQYDYEKATYYLKRMLDDGMHAPHVDARVLDAIRDRPSRAFTGLGEKPDPAYDPGAEPPWLPVVEAKKALSIPRVEDAPLFAHAIDRLQGRLPLENSNVMVVFHRYADVATLMDLFARAGMSPKNAAFVSTPYPFDPAFDRALDDLGVQQEKFPVYDLDGFGDAVERGIRRMIAQYDDRKDKHGYGKPILILDDGGNAAKTIAAKFKDHAHKFKVVEVTAAGHRIAADLKEKHARVPFVYYSVAYSAAKRQVASSFYATRVVDRLRTFSDATGVQPPNKKVVVVGAGPMGRFAALYMQKLGYEVSIVDKSAAVREEMIAAGIDPARVYSDAQMKQALKGRGTVLAMSGFMDVVGPQHLDAIMDGAIVAQGASKRNDFDMTGFESAAQKKTAIARDDDVPQPSYTYDFGGKQLHFVGDGWTINHDGSLHGSPFEDVQLETALLFESVVEAAGDRTTWTGDLKVVGADVQDEYLALWRAHYGAGRDPSA